MSYKLCPTFKFYIRENAHFVLINETLYKVESRHLRFAEYTKLDSLTEVSELYFEIQLQLTRDKILAMKNLKAWWFILGTNTYSIGNVRLQFRKLYIYFRYYVLKQNMDLDFEMWLAYDCD